jgi:hypothetical protein
MTTRESHFRRRITGAILSSMVLILSPVAGKGGEKGVLRFAMHGEPIGIDRKGTLNP